MYCLKSLIIDKIESKLCIHQAYIGFNNEIKLKIQKFSNYPIAMMNGGIFIQTKNNGYFITLDELVENILEANSEILTLIKLNRNNYESEEISAAKYVNLRNSIHNCLDKNNILLEDLYFIVERYSRKKDMV